MDRLLQKFRQIWVWDSEFVIVPGWHVTPVCMAGVEVRLGCLCYGDVRSRRAADCESAALRA